MVLGCRNRWRPAGYHFAPGGGCIPWCVWSPWGDDGIPIWEEVDGDLSDVFWNVDFDSTALGGSLQHIV